MDLDKLTSQLKAFAQDRAEIIAIYLFGSQAKDRTRPDSDVDLAVLVRPEGQDLFDLELKLDSQISRLECEHQVEVLVLNRAPVTMQFEIVSTGRLLHSKDENFRTDWEVSMLNRYYDVRPLHKAYDRAYIQRFKESFTDAQRREYERTLATLARTD